MWHITTDGVAWSVSLSVMIVSPTKTAELIEIPFWTRILMGSRYYVLDGDAHLCHLVNMTKPSVCRGDVALGQIPLTIYFIIINILE